MNLGDLLISALYGVGEDCIEVEEEKNRQVEVKIRGVEVEEMRQKSESVDMILTEIGKNNVE